MHAQSHDSTSHGVAFMPGLSKFPDYYRTKPDGSIEEMTRTEFKEARRKEVTVRNQHVPICGHSFVSGREPRHKNCESCWFSFFQVHGELTQAAEEVFAKFGESGLRQLRGPKFTKHFKRFMGVIAQWKAITDAAKAPSEEKEQ